MVRIHLPPAASQERTLRDVALGLSAVEKLGEASDHKEPFPRVCASRARRLPLVRASSSCNSA
jgi:hypothetical protein